MLFLSTPSARRATLRGENLWLILVISIHALREEGDVLSDMQTKEKRHFYPRPPRGGRLWDWRHKSKRSSYFYPRPPRGGRPDAQVCGLPAGSISIHALREEGDCCAVTVQLHNQLFLSTPSARRATLTINLPAGAYQFLSTPSARRATGTWPTIMLPL